jgi:DNA-binding CsgD family transcriptional regulator/transcriptional regulator with XRE-family HTH domain/tetratricopeptide (TPR) repeat protein
LPSRPLLGRAACSGLVKGRLAVAEQPALSFAGMLRLLRTAARLTQEELAEAAGLSPRSVSDLERGVHQTARKDTAGLLADALGLTGPVRVLFVAAARRRASAAEVLAATDGVWPGVFAAAATRTLPRDTASFTGRERELSRLLAALGGDARVVLVSGDAGVGKTRFAGEGMAAATAAGMVMLWGECLPMAGTLPLLPVASALGELGSPAGGGLLEAALDAAPGFVQTEVGRLLPQLEAREPGPPGGLGLGGRDGGWQRERLFAGVAELLAAVAQRAPVGLVVEDVHWADSETLDCLTLLGRPGRRDAVTVVVTCRGDEAPLAAHVADWLAQMRGSGAVEEIRLGPLSRAEVAEQVAVLAGGPVLPGVVDELYARAEGNPFFTEQLVAAALTSQVGSVLRVPAGLPGRLAELLAARAGRCAGDARALLAGLAVAGRPLTEDLLGQVTGLDAATVRGGLRELAMARLLAEDAPGTGHRPRHALLAEAVVGGLLPGERAGLHARTARALQATGDQTLAAEAAGHWQAAGRPAEELPARVTAAETAERVFGYAEAAAHWQRAIELCAALPGAAGIEVPRIYIRAIDALELSGDGMQADTVAEEAYRRFSGHPDAVTAAVIRVRAAYLGAIDAPATGLSLIEEALQLFGQCPPSADHARAWLDYATIFAYYAEGQQAKLTALNLALEIAEAADATALIPSILASRAGELFMRAQVDEGFATLDRGRALARASGDSTALVRLAVCESDALFRLARFQSAADVASRGLRAAGQAGLGAWNGVTLLAATASEALLALGDTAEAAALIDPLTTGPPDRDHWWTHEARAEIDLLRGDIAAAAGRHQRVRALGNAAVRHAPELAWLGAEVALWAGRPSDAIQEVSSLLTLFKAPQLLTLVKAFHLMGRCGRLLTSGIRACADLAERARARLDQQAVSVALAAADGLASWVDQMSGAPFTDHPLVATIPAERATWEAEWTRLAGPSDPAAWRGAAKAWQDLGCPHRAGYARWRQAQAQLDAGQPATAVATALRAAAAAADGHAPLLAQIRLLAERARIPLQAPATTLGKAPPPAEMPAPRGLTGRELAVLRLLAAGRTNAQIGAELYISPRTAGVHVSNILRKLGVTGRVQAAAIAERAGLLSARQP